LVCADPMGTAASLPRWWLGRLRWPGWLWGLRRLWWLGRRLRWLGWWVWLSTRRRLGRSRLNASSPGDLPTYASSACFAVERLRELPNYCSMFRSRDEIWAQEQREKCSAPKSKTIAILPIVECHAEVANPSLLCLAAETILIGQRSNQCKISRLPTP
jgi:hypothetical protein